MERLAYQSLEIFILSTDYKLFYSLTPIKPLLIMLRLI